MRVLVTGARAPGGPSTKMMLRAAGHDAIGVDAANGSILPCTGADDEAYAASLLDACKRYQVNVVLPLTTAEVGMLCRPKWRNFLLFEGGARVAVSDSNSVQGANDKLHVMRTVQRHLPLLAADFVEVRRRQHLASFQRGAPFVIKPQVGNGGRGVYKVVFDNPLHHMMDRELPVITYQALLDALPAEHPGLEDPIIAMDYLEGEEYTVDCYLGTGKGQFIALTRLRNKVRCGVTAAGEVLAMGSKTGEYIADVSRTLAYHMGLFGVFGFQFRRDYGGSLKVLECNPRMQGSMDASFYAGVNFADLAVRDAMNQRIDTASLNWKPGAYYRESGGVFMPLRP